MKIGIICKYLFAAGSSVLLVMEETIPFAFVLLVAIIADCISAYDLGRRISKKSPMASGKFKSNYAFKMVGTMIKMYSVIILLKMTEEYVLIMHDLHLSAYCTCLFVMLTLISILENMSSHSDETWAKILQKILVDKTERHFDLKQGTLKKKKNGKNK